MFKSVLVSLMLLICLSLAAQELPPTPTVSPDSKVIPADAKNVVNPVNPTLESIAQGKKYYGYDCAMCHGKNGDGKGDLGKGVKVGAFTDPATLEGKTDGDLFYILKNGSGNMPLEPIRNNPNELWNLINYIRSLSAKPAQ